MSIFPTRFECSFPEKVSEPVGITEYEQFISLKEPAEYAQGVFSTRSECSFPYFSLVSSVVVYSPSLYTLFLFSFEWIFKVLSARQWLIFSTRFECIPLNFSTRPECIFPIFPTRFECSFPEKVSEPVRVTEYEQFSSLREPVEYAQGVCFIFRFECKFTSSPLVSSVSLHLLNSFGV
jgi:hypothetical protein